MRVDKFSQVILENADLIDIIMRDPDQQFATILVEPFVHTQHDLELENYPNFVHYTEPAISVAEFDRRNQQTWLMPPEYKSLDIAQHVLDLCETEPELQRCSQELILYQQRDMFDLLRYLLYLVDTMRANNIVWGVGRGSSVASFVLYKLGVHKINSMYYDLDIHEFLKPLSLPE